MLQFSNFCVTRIEVVLGPDGFMTLVAKQEEVLARGSSAEVRRLVHKIAC